MKTDGFWLYAFSPTASDGDCPRSGKWMLFTSATQHNAVWNTIRDATEAGTLGCGAKTAIPVPDANPLYANSGYLLTCIYTYDFDDQKDVRRVLTGLRQLGFTHRLSYKSDADTLSGTYGPGSAMYVSQPNSLDFEDRRVTR